MIYADLTVFSELSSSHFAVLTHIKPARVVSWSQHYSIAQELVRNTGSWALPRPQSVSLGLASEDAAF